MNIRVIVSIYNAAHIPFQWFFINSPNHSHSHSHNPTALFLLSASQFLSLIFTTSLFLSLISLRTKTLTCWTKNTILQYYKLNSAFSPIKERHMYKRSSQHTTPYKPEKTNIPWKIEIRKKRKTCVVREKYWDKRKKKWIDMGEREEINEKKIVSISPVTQLLTSIISTKFDVK